MTEKVATDNLDVAEKAREMADSAPAGSLQKAAAGSVAVACATTRTIDDARAVLAGIVPEDARQAALDLLDDVYAAAAE